MNKDDFDNGYAYRSMRWHEWLACLLLLFMAAGVRAATIYRCDDGHGTSFQDRPCAAGQQSQVVKVASAPTHAPSPQYAVAPAGAAGAGKVRTARTETGNRRRDVAASTAHSYECRSTDGQVFYRHTACPHSVEARDDHFGRGRGAQKKVEVHSIRVTREEACSQMHRAGASGRSGHANDEVASSYEKNLGHDPCR